MRPGASSPSRCTAQLSSGWQLDDTVTVSCGEEPGPGPTPGDTTTTTHAQPGPGGTQPTIVAIQRQTVPGSDVFIVGGVAPDLEVDISLYPFPDNWESYNHWRLGDNHLDWDGPEEGQGTHAPDEDNPIEYPVLFKYFSAPARYFSMCSNNQG